MTLSINFLLPDHQTSRRHLPVAATNPNTPTCAFAAPIPAPRAIPVMHSTIPVNVGVC